MEIGSYNVDFLEDEFQALVKLKRILNYVSYNNTFKYLFMRGRIRIIAKSSRMWSSSI